MTRADNFGLPRQSVRTLDALLSTRIKNCLLFSDWNPQLAGEPGPPKASWHLGGIGYDGVDGCKGRTAYRLISVILWSAGSDRRSSKWHAAADGGNGTP
jgi:hypothetical protein